LDITAQQALTDAHFAALQAGVMYVIASSGLSQRALAQTLGVGETYVSRLLAHNADEISIAFINRAMCVLKLNNKMRETLRFHLEQYKRSLFIETAIQFEDSSEHLMQTVFDWRVDALLHKDPVASKTLFWRCRHRGQLVLNLLLKRRSYYLAARVALVLNDICHTLNALPLAMFYARLARELLLRVHPVETPDTNHYLVNAIYAEGVTLRLLGFGRQARKKHQEITTNHKQSPWFVHALREDLMAYLLNSHVDEKVALKLFAQHQRAMFDFNHPDHAIWRLTMQRQVAEIEIASRKFASAVEKLTELENQITATQGMTVIHHTSLLHLKGRAQLYDKKVDAGLETLHITWNLAVEAGLLHQQKSIMKTFRLAGIEFIT
jgi:transcriptional regulator with XRE-family HTH domain